ncbi:MAG: hypothetical protein FRX49_08511 [Trebouxia sp. A1-2]|nr:MAG: hypothetical protein FRX49_08511 [Trebouxia sp. A1-2]
MSTDRKHMGKLGKPTQEGEEEFELQEILAHKPTDKNRADTSTSGKAMALLIIPWNLFVK